MRTTKEMRWRQQATPAAGEKLRRRDWGHRGDEEEMNEDVTMLC